MRLRRNIDQSHMIVNHVFRDDYVVTDKKRFSIYRLPEIINSLGFKLNPLNSIVTENVDEVEFLRFVISCGYDR